LDGFFKPSKKAKKKDTKRDNKERQIIKTEKGGMKRRKKWVKDALGWGKGQKCVYLSSRRKCGCSTLSKITGEKKKDLEVPKVGVNILQRGKKSAPWEKGGRYNDLILGQRVAGKKGAKDKDGGFRCGVRSGEKRRNSSV